MALASVTLAFWPPERATPLSPTKVLSPYGHFMKKKTLLAILICYRMPKYID
jgi:hypothetical protein